MKISPEWEYKLDTLPQGIFFTSFVLAFVALALFLALLYRQTDLTLFALTLLVLAIGLKFWSRLSTNGLEYRLSIDKRKVFPGEKVNFHITVSNNKLLPVLVDIRLLLPRGLVSENRDSLIREQSGILWYQTIFFHRELSPLRRGLYKSGTPRLIAGDFFGFFPRPTPERQEIEILVFPRLVPVKPFPVLKRIMFGKKADSSPIHDPIHILGTRDYRSFSSARNIHWKATARHHKLQEKIFEVTEQEKLIIILEADGFIHNTDETAFERTIEVIAALSVLMDGKHYLTGFLTNCAMHGHGPHYLAPAGKPGHLSGLFEMLAKIDFNVTFPMNDHLAKAPYSFADVCCLFFSYEPVKETFPMAHINAPTVNIICRPRPDEQIMEERFMTSVRSFFLEDIMEAV